MSIESASVSVPSSIPVSALTVKDISSAKSTEKSFVSQTIERTTHALPITISKTSVQKPSVQHNVSSSIKTFVSIPASLPKQLVSSGTAVTVAATARPSLIQSSNIPQGKTHLPVRPVPIASLSRVESKPTALPNTTAPVMIDRGGYGAKLVAVQPALLPNSISGKSPKVAQAQHILMAPGLRTPSPSLKVHTTYSTVRSITTSQPTRKLVPLAVTCSQDPTRLTARTTNILHQPTSTISISVPARSIAPHDSTNLGPCSRIAITSQIAKPLYQVGITPLLPSSTSVAKAPRIITAVQPTLTSNTANSLARGISLPTCNGAATLTTSVTAFTYSTTLCPLPVASITTSAIPVAKIFPQQPQSRVPLLQPSVCSASDHVRTTDELLLPIASSKTQLSAELITKTSSVSVASVVTSLAAPKTSTQPVTYRHLQPGTNPSTTVYNTAASLSPATIRTPLISTSNPSKLTEAQIRISQSALFGLGSPNRLVSSSSTMPAFTQGQLLHTSSPSLTGKEQARLLQPHLPTCIASAVPQHVTNSPKPAILRRSPRADANVVKKLPFESRLIGTPPSRFEHKPLVGALPDGNAVDMAKRFSVHDIYPISIKPELSGQVSFNKPPASSNGLVLPSKLQTSSTKDFHNPPFLPPGFAEDRNFGKRVPHNLNELKIKTEPGPQQSSFKGKAPSAFGHQTYHSPYPLPANKLSDGTPHLLPFPVPHPGDHQPENKPRHIQHRPGALGVSTPHNKAHHTAATTGISGGTKVGANNFSKSIKPDPNAIFPLSGVKREYDKISHSDAEINCSPSGMTVEHSFSAQLPIGLSPRKKPRKQTHIIAEEYPDQEVDGDKSTDDADEWEDEVSSSVTSLTTNATPVIANANLTETQSIRTYSTAVATTSVTSGLAFSSTSDIKSPDVLISSEDDPPSEYVDDKGVRYVAVRQRPPFLLLNGYRKRSVNNHFNHHSDVKVKEKKTTLHNINFDEKYLRGWKILQFAAQAEDLALLDADILRRIETVKQGLLEHGRSLIANGKAECKSSCPSPVSSSKDQPRSVPSTPTQPFALTSFVKNFSSSCNFSNSHVNSPLTSTELKASRLHEEILKVEDKAQANIQRCNLIQEQLLDAKTIMVEVLQLRKTAERLVKVGREAQKSSKSSSNNSNRATKKKKS